MLRESHTIAKPQPTTLPLVSVLTLLSVWLVLAPCAQAFNLGWHRKAATNEASGQPDTKQEAKPDPRPGDKQDAKTEAKPDERTPAIEEAKQDSKQEAGEVKAAVVRTDEAKPLTKGESKAAPPVEKGSGAQAKKTEIIRRKDFSGRFSFVLPEGWGAYQIPYQTHDVLSLRENNAILATISFADEIGKNTLEKLKDATIENSKKLLQKYELVESKMMALPGGQPCAKIVSRGQIEDVDARQVQYVVSLKKKYFMVITLTVAKPVGEKYDKLLQDVVTSISTDPVSAKPIK